MSTVDGFTWTRHRITGGYFRCPDDALDDMAKKGWEPSEAPPEPNPAVAEQLAWRAAQAAAQAAADEADKTKPTEAARRGESE